MARAKKSCENPTHVPTHAVVVVVVGSPAVVVLVVVNVETEVSEVEVLMGRFVGGTPPPAVEHPVSWTTPLVWYASG
jgi:hypothetical protein